MNDNLYDILGVTSTAEASEIRKAYRKLAARFHPDRNSDPGAAERFQEICKAYEVLGSEERRPLYDKYGDIALNPNFKGFEQTPEQQAAEYNDWFTNFGRGSSHGTQSYQGSDGYDDRFSQDTAQSSGYGQGHSSWDFGGFSQEDQRRYKGKDDQGRTNQGRTSRGFSAEYHDPYTTRNNRRQDSNFGFNTNPSGFEPPQKGTEIRATIDISLIDAIRGCQRNMVVERATRWKRGSNAGLYKENVSIDIPKSVQSGHQITIRGKGNPGKGGGSAGDLLITVNVVPHPHLYQQGADLFLQVPLTMQEALLGTTIEVPTLQGNVRIKTPASVKNGQKMRLKNRGAPKETGGNGDFYLVLRPIIPEGNTEKLRQLAKELENFYPPGGVRADFRL